MVGSLLLIAVAVGRPKPNCSFVLWSFQFLQPRSIALSLERAKASPVSLGKPQTPPAYRATPTASLQPSLFSPPPHTTPAARLGALKPLDYGLGDRYAVQPSYRRQTDRAQHSSCGPTMTIATQ